MYWDKHTEKLIHSNIEQFQTFNKIRCNVLKVGSVLRHRWLLFSKNAFKRNFLLKFHNSEYDSLLTTLDYQGIFNNKQLPTVSSCCC